MKKMILFLVFLSNSILLFSQTITEDNWVNHAIIKEVRELYLYTENHISSSDFVKYEKNPVYLGDFIVNTNAFIDGNLVIRKLVYDESEYGRFIVSIYYDSNQIIRFAYVTTEVYETSDIEYQPKLEYRIYFDVDGNMVWKAKSADGNYIAFGDEVDIFGFEHFFKECPYEIFHQNN
jgi:hypothetical protein